MRVLHPLFNFQYFDGEDFAFSDGRLSIRHFDGWGALTDRPIFSQRDRDHMEAEWPRVALVAEGDDLEGYKVDVSLLLMTFRLLADGAKTGQGGLVSFSVPEPNRATSASNL